MQISQRLARCQRIVDSASFKVRGRNRVSVHGKHFKIHAVCNGFSHPRLGLVVSKKVSKKAVQRNRIKRQIREAFRHSQDLFSNMDIIVIANPGASGEFNPTLRQELMHLFQVSQKKCRSQR